MLSAHLEETEPNTVTAPHPTAGDLTHLVKAYDVRGTYPEQLDERIAEVIGAAFVRVTGAAAITVGWDMRPSSPALSDAFSRGAASQGADVVKIGLASTDQLYFASGHLNLPGAMFTASHNPAKYNGIKMCRAGAAPVGQDTGLAEIRDLAARELAEPGTVITPAAAVGTITERDLLTAYAEYMRKLVDIRANRRLKVVVDAGNGMGGHTVPVVFEGLPIDLVPLYFELDGSFPNHEANPLDPKNLVDLQKKVVEAGADIGLAFDGDADRCFVVDERGEPVPPSAVTALVAVRELAKHPGATIIHNLITSHAVSEIVREHGGTPVRTRVGHSFIKQKMAETGAVFGGEHSAHYYFADFWKADTGMLAAMHVLAALGEQEAPLSQLTAEYSRYSASGEINSEVADQAGRTAAVRAAYADEPGVTIDDLDGMTVQGDGWWFNLRPSNTEPLLRLNIEARTPDEVAAIRDAVLAIVRA